MLRVFERHPFRYLWRGPEVRSNSAARRAINILETDVSNIVNSSEPHVAAQTDYRRIFPPWHRNGTFTIGERQGEAPFIMGETLSFEGWVKQAVADEIGRIKRAGLIPPGVTPEQLSATPDVVLEALAYEGSNGRLSDLIPNQTYIDYFTRIISLFWTGSPETTFYVDRQYNEIGKELALGIISDKQYQATVSLHTRMIHAVFAGIMGLDLKSSHCAASVIDTTNIIPFLSEPGTSRESRIRNALKNICQKYNFGYLDFLFHWEQYRQKVLKGNCLLAHFPDDLTETVFDLDSLQAQMRFNPLLQVVLLPRSGRFGNDASFEDVDELIDEHVIFTDLKRFRDEGRLVVSDKGPKGGSVEAPNLSQESIEWMLKADALYFKGARTFELLGTGINRPTFFAQTVVREFSESIVGTSGTAAIPILIFHQSLPSFWGFRRRGERNGSLYSFHDSTKRGSLALMTAMESTRFMRDPYYRELLHGSPLDKASEVMAISAETGLPPHKVVTYQVA